MSHDQVTHTYPRWLRWLNVIAACVLLVFAGILSIFTQSHLAGRIPDWIELGPWMAFLLPAACDIYEGVSTVNWAAAPEGSVTRRRARRGLVVSIAISELMNVGEHTWAYGDAHHALGWWLVPILLVGSLPTTFVFLGVHLASAVLTETPTSAEIPAPVEVTFLAEVPETTVVDLPWPKFPVRTSSPVPLPVPVPAPILPPESAEPAEPKPPRAIAHIEDIAWIIELHEQGATWEELTGKELEAKAIASQGWSRRTRRSWQALRTKAKNRVEQKAA